MLILMANANADSQPTNSILGFSYCKEERFSNQGCWKKICVRRTGTEETVCSRVSSTTGPRVF